VITSHDEAVEYVRDELSRAILPVFDHNPVEGVSRENAARVVLWAMLSLAVDVALALGMELSDVQDFCNRAAQYAENAKPVRDAERLTTHLKRGEA
jgi:hypothetical protein